MQSSFALLWLSETALDLGSALIGFALGVWIFQETGSAEQFSRAMLAQAAPAILMAPVAGTLADRFDRRLLIACCDLVSVIAIACLGWLLLGDRLAVVHLYVFSVVGALVNAVRTPAYRAAVSMIVPSERLTQASGLVGVTQSALQIGSPLVAGYLMAAAGFDAVIAVDVLVVCGGALAAFAGLSRARHALRGVDDTRRLSLLAGARASAVATVRFFRGTPLMTVLAAYGLLQESLLVLVTALMTPLVLSTHTSEALGLVLSCGAVGGLVGAALLLFMPLQRQLMVAVLAADVVLSVFVLLAGATRSTVWWCTCAFVALLCASASSACARALWMRKTPQSARGSIFAWTGSLGLLATCGVLLVGGPLAERVLEPALAPGGAWAEGVGAWVGVGKGRGIGLLFIVCGAASGMVSLAALASPRLRRLDRSVADELASSLRPAPG